MLIKELHMSVLHRFICPNFNGTSKDNRVTKTQFYMFYYLQHKCPFSTFVLIIDVMWHFIRTKHPIHFYPDHIVTVLASHFFLDRFRE